jgi:hypothetical protein
MQPYKFDIATTLATLLGALVAWLVGSGTRYMLNRAAKPRINSSVRRANMGDMNAITSESLVLEAAQMQQKENSDLRKEQREIYTDMMKLAKALGRAEGKLEGIAPVLDNAMQDETMLFLSEPFGEPRKDDAREDRNTNNNQPNDNLEFLSKSERKPNIIKEKYGEQSEPDFGESFRRNTGGNTGASRTRTDVPRKSDRTSRDSKEDRAAGFDDEF